MARSSFKSQLWTHHLPSYCSRSRLQYFGRYLSCVVPFRANPVDSAFRSEALTWAFVCLHSWRRYHQRFRRVSWSSCAFQRLFTSVANSLIFLWIFSFCIPGQSFVIFSIDLKHNLLHLYVYMCPNPSRYCIIVVLWMREKAIFLLKWFIMYASVWSSYTECNVNVSMNLLLFFLIMLMFKMRMFLSVF